MPADDQGLDYLLDLHGELRYLEGGSWFYKIEARRARQSAPVPHGVRYSLTLHKSSGERVLGYDNARHKARSGKQRFTGQRVEWDHRHELNRVSDYHFESAYQLLADFFVDIDRILEEFEDGHI